MTKKRFTTVERVSDTCEINIAGETFTPHIGESVHFVPYLSIGKALRLTEVMDMLSQEESEEDSEETITIMDQLKAIAEIAGVVAQAIDHWNWTHPISGKKLGKKHGTEYRPDSESIQELSTDEVSFLINEFFESMSPDENPPQASSDKS